MAYNYINPETENMFEYLNENIDPERKRYIYKPISSELLDIINSKIKGSINKIVKLSDDNPLFSKITNKEFFDTKDIIFMKMDTQKNYNLGIVMFGKFSNGEKLPDMIDMYLAKDTKEGVVLWKKIKEAPGLRPVYNTGTTFKVQRQLITSGASKDNKGSEVAETNAFEITTALRTFFTAAAKENTKAYKLIKSVLEDDRSIMINGHKSFFHKSDSWFSKMNGLVSGKLENSIFTMSQIKDGDILKTKTSMGEQYVLKRKMNIEVFEEAMAGFKRDSTTNRGNFFKEFHRRYEEAKKNRDKDLEKIASGALKEGDYIDPFKLNYFKDQLKKISIDEFKNNLTVFKDLIKLLDGKEENEKEYIKGKDIKNILEKREDYLSKGKFLENELRSKIKIEFEYKKEKYKEKMKYSKEPDFYDYNFKISDVRDLIDKINSKYEKVEKSLISEMSKRINSKADTIVDHFYYERLENASEADYKKVMEYVKEDIARNFFDSYNEKFDLFEIMKLNRQTAKIKELDLMADMVNFVYDDKGKITDVKIRESYNTEINPFRKNEKGEILDNELRYGYYKIRNSIGTKKFDAMKLEERLQLAEQFLKDNKTLLRKHSEETILGKYDTMDNFKNFKNSVNKKIAYESLSGDLMSRTGDKIISSINYRTNDLEVTGAMKIDDDYFKLKFNFGRNDGFNKNDWIKELESDRQAAFKLMDYETQKLIEDMSPKYQKNYILQRLLGEAQRGLNREDEFEELEFQKLQFYKSFLKGQEADNGNFGIYKFKDSDGNEKELFAPLKFMTKEQKNNARVLTNYNRIYDNITYYLSKNHGDNLNYKDKVGYLLARARRDKDEDMSSMISMMSNILMKDNVIKHLNNTAFMAVLNRDQIVNTTGSAKQTSLAHGDSYLTSLGFTLPGMAWNKVTQRTFQSQDLLGERVVKINGVEKTVSELNAMILSKTGFSGVGLRLGKYTTEEMLKDAINNLNDSYGLRNSPYVRGTTYKTFAIGDVNTAIGDGLNSFSASFQEGMTATRNMQLTTNAIRNKEFKLNLEEINFEKLNIDGKTFSSTAEIHNFIKDEDNLNKLIKEILPKELYETIEGREKFRNIMEQFSSGAKLKHLDLGTTKGLLSYYNFMVDTLQKEHIYNSKYRKFSNTDTQENRMNITREIQNILGDLNKATGAIVEPNTKKGKTIITTDVVKTHNELKPEIGFSVSGYKYNDQTHNIEIMFENIASSAQGSKGQASGAKFTISEIYDFMKVKTKNDGDIWIDAVFNNKGEKRTQTGMMIHGLLQTVFTNAFEAKGLKGVELLRDNMSELLNDLGVEIVTNSKYGVYEIEESYLTKQFQGTKNKNGLYDFSDKKRITADEFQKLLSDPLANTGKIFSERGKEILDRVTKKYGASYYNADGELITGSQAHTGVMRAIHSAYTKTFKEFGTNSYIPLTTQEATVVGYQGKKEFEFGSGNLYIFKLASERVNSNASKKKEDASKVSREMVEMLRTSGYNQLSNYIQKKNTSRLSDYMGGLYASMTNSELLNTIYDHNKNFDLTKVNKSISENIDNGILLNLSELEGTDYLLNDKEKYFKHNRLIEGSILGKAMKEKGLEKASDGKLENNINIVINDDIMESFTREIQGAMQRTNEFLKTLSEVPVDPKISSYEYNAISKSIEAFSQMKDTRTMNYKEYEYLKESLNKAVKTLRDKNIGEKENIRDMNITAKLLEMYKKNLTNKNDFALKQLQTAFKTGSVIVTVGLGYDVSETDDSIIPDEEFNRITDIAKKYYEIKSFDKSYKPLEEKIIKKDKSIVDDIYNDVLDFYSGNKKIDEVKTSYQLFNSLDISNKYSNIFEASKNIMDSTITLEIDRQSTNEKFAEIYAYTDITKDEYEKRFNLWEQNMKSRQDEIDSNKKIVFKKLKDSSTTSDIKKEIENVIFNNKRLENKKTFDRFYKEKIKEQFDLSFDLLEDYVKIPDSAKRIFQKKGKLTSMQKFKIDSSFTANPLEGSNLLTKIEELMFQGFNGKQVTNANQVRKNLEQLEEFLGSAVVNENLFKDLSGNDMLLELERGGRNNFKEGLDKARAAFNRNIAELSEITITSKDFTKAFRGKDFEPKDIFGNSSVDISEKGFYREMVFLGRHPQQTYNHMGGVMNITIDTNKGYLKNKFANAVLTYLPKEKNQAGVVTFGKKTMLYRRGDHDGDKVQMAFLDFIEDSKVKFDTQARSFIDFQIKNNTFGKWDDNKGMFTEFTGKVLDDNGNIVELKGKNKKEIFEYLNEKLGYSEEEFNMHTKGFLNFSHAVRERTKKEFKKHYNSIYEMENVVDQFMRTGKAQNISNSDINLLEGVLDKASSKYENSKITVGSDYAKRYINNSRSFIDSLRNRNKDFNIHDIDLITTTALYKMQTSEKPYNSINDLYKDTMKEIEKFIDRGTFNEFYKEKSSKGIFDELTGQRNTGKTHTYATSIRKTGTDIMNMKPTEVMAKIGNVKGLSVEGLKEIQKLQKYSAHSMDLFADNMIESAISAKHGLTLGGLEGSKIFTNKLLARNSEDLNNKVVSLYNDVFVNTTSDRNKAKTVNLLEGIVAFKKGFDDQGALLEDVISRAEEKGLNRQLLYKAIDLRNEDFGKIYGELIDPKQIKQYSFYKNEYKNKFREIEEGLFNSLMKKKYVNPDEYEMYKGLNLFGEMLIQNDPGLEYDVNDAYEAIQKFRKGDIKFEELMSNKEIINLKHQAYTSLGSAASISSISMAKDYINAYQERILNNKTDNELIDFLDKVFIPYFAQNYTGKSKKVEDLNYRKIFNFEDLSSLISDKDKDQDFKKVVDNFLNSETVTNFQKELVKQRSRNSSPFYKKIMAKSNNPISEYAMALNVNNAIFNHEGKTGEESFALLKDFYENGVPSINDSPLSDSVKNLHKQNTNFVNNVIKKYSYIAGKNNGFEDFNLDDFLSDIKGGDDLIQNQRKEIVKQINSSINSAIFEMNKKHFRIANPKLMTKLIVGREPTYLEKNLIAKDRAFVIPIDDKTKSNIPTIRNFYKKINSNRGENFYIEDASFLYTNNGLLNLKALNRLKKTFVGDNKYNRNIYFTPEVIKKLVQNDETIMEKFINPVEKQNIAQQMLDAYRYLGEDLTEANALKRLKGGFDSRLAATVMVENKNSPINRLLKINNLNEIEIEKYKKRLITNLDNILTDFKHIDLGITNQNIDYSYLKLAKTFTDENRYYKNVSSSLCVDKYIKNVDNIDKFLKYIIRKEQKWLDSINVDYGSYRNKVISELITRNKISDKEFNNILYNSAKSISNLENIGVKHFKYNKQILKLINRWSETDKGKAALGATFGSIGLLGLGKLIKPFISKEGGKYIAGSNLESMTLDELYKNLNFTNGMKTNLYAEELKGAAPIYTSIKKKLF